MGIRLAASIGTILLLVTFCSAAGIGRKIRQDESCPSEGFFRDEMNCGKFYRCVTLPAGLHADSSSSIGRYEFNCPDGTVFDQRVSTCNYPNQVDPSDSCANQHVVHPPPPTQPPPPPPTQAVPSLPPPPQSQPQLPTFVPGQIPDGTFPVLSPPGSRFILPQFQHLQQPQFQHLQQPQFHQLQPQIQPQPLFGYQHHQVPYFNAYNIYG